MPHTNSNRGPWSNCNDCNNHMIATTMQVPCSGTASGTKAQEGVTVPNPFKPRAQDSGLSDLDHVHRAWDTGCLVSNL